MLSWDSVISYVKANIALPSTFIEDSDPEIIDYIKLTAHREFSSIMPDSTVTGINTAALANQHPTLNSHYFFHDEENLPIIAIKQCYFPDSNALFSGHPIVGPTSMKSARSWALQVFKSRFIRPFSEFNSTYKFIAPNIVHVLRTNFTTPDEIIVIEYERVHPYDLRTIPEALSMDYMDLSLAHVMIKLGNLRSHYGDSRIESPFGSIPLNGETLKSDGRELRREVIERLRQESIPPVVIDIE